MEVLTKTKPSSTVLENQKEKETLKNTLDYTNGKGEKSIYDVHNYGKNGVLYFKKK